MWWKKIIDPPICLLTWCYVICAGWIVFLLAFLFAPSSPECVDTTTFYADRWFEKALRLIPNYAWKITDKK